VVWELTFGVDSNGDYCWKLDARITNKDLLTWYRVSKDFHDMIEDNIDRGVLVGEA
jgi:hypothetical protein